MSDEHDSALISAQDLYEGIIAIGRKRGKKFLLSDFRSVIVHWTNVFVPFAYSLYVESRIVQKLILRYFQSSEKFLDNRKSIVKLEGG